MDRKNNWGGVRVASPGKKLGRGDIRTYQKIPIRLDPWLITRLELKRQPQGQPSDDLKIIKRYIMKGLDYVLKAEKGGDRTWVDLQPLAALYGSSHRGWEQQYTSFVPTFAGADLEKLKLAKKPDESMTQLLQRLIAIAATTEGISRLFADVTLDDIPMREEYQAKIKTKKSTGGLKNLAQSTRKTRLPSNVVKGKRITSR
jgi:hypothetical protein